MTENVEKPAAEKALSPARKIWREWVRPLLVVLAVLFAVRSAVADWNDVPTGSMKPTILEGDRIFVNKLAYDLRVPFLGWRLVRWSSPDRGAPTPLPEPAPHASICAYTSPKISWSGSK